MNGRSLQHRRIVCTGKADVLNSDQIDAGFPESHAANNVVVEVLVGEQSDHVESRPAWRAIRRARIPVGSKSRSFARLTSAAVCSRARR